MGSLSLMSYQILLDMIMELMPVSGDFISQSSQPTDKLKVKALPDSAAYSTYFQADFLECIYLMDTFVLAL
jgi:hypothetical protein